MPQTNTHDSFLWYGKEIPSLKDLGLVVPNPGGSDHTQNQIIQQLVATTTQYAQRFMLHKDAGRLSYPSITTMVQIHKSLVSAMRLLESRIRESNQTRLEPDHANQQWFMWRLFPVPVYGPQIKNTALKDYATLLLTACTEMMQHSDNNGLQQTLTPEFADAILPYFRTVYTRMSVDYFGKTLAETQVENFVLTQEDINNYDPTKFRADPLEMVATPTDPALSFTENQLMLITNGVDASNLPQLGPWPTAIPVPQAAVANPLSAATGSGNTSGQITTGSVTAGNVTQVPQI